MMKLVPVLVHNFDFRLKHADREWTCENYWMPRALDFQVFVERRKA